VTEDEAAGSTSPSSRQSPSLSLLSLSLSSTPPGKTKRRTYYSLRKLGKALSTQPICIRCIYILFAGFYSLSFFCFWVKQIWSVTLSSLSYITRQQNC
jgi:hypothetical protein